MLERLKQYRRKAYLRMLTARGLKIGKNVYLNDGFFLDPSHCFLITIEDGVVFGPCVRIFAHDASSLKVVGKTKIGLVYVGRNAFVGANSTLLPASSLGENSILGAQSVLSRDVPANEVWGGNPARFIMTVADYRRKLEAMTGEDFSESDHRIDVLTPERRERMIQSLRLHQIGFMAP